MEELNQQVLALWGDNPPVTLPLGLIPQEGTNPGIGFLTVSDTDSVFTFVRLAPHITGGKKGKPAKISFQVWAVARSKCQPITVDGVEVWLLDRRFIQVISCDGSMTNKFLTENELVTAKQFAPIIYSTFPGFFDRIKLP